MHLLEREGPLARLADWLREAADGRGRLVHLGAEAGLGKTSLLRALEASRPAGAVTWWGECDAFALPRPLGPLEDIAHEAGGELARALKVVERPQRIFQALLRQMEQARPPVLVVIEDVHWADDGTRDLLRFLGRRLRGVPALVVATHRPEELAPGHPLAVLLGDQATHPDVARLELAPLSTTAIRALVGERGIDAGALLSRTGGNPFFVTELLALEEVGLPATVRDAVLARAARLSPEGRGLLDAAAVLGGAWDGASLLELAGSPPEALDECVARGVLQITAGRVAFRHEIARDAVASAVPAARSRALHARIVKRARGTEPAPERLADLAHHAEQAGDAEAVRAWAPAAGRHAAALHAHREAALQFERALRVGGPWPDAERADLLEARAFECYLTDQMAEAMAARSEALELRRAIGQPASAADDLRWLSRLSWFMGAREDAERFAREAHAAVPPHGAERVRGMVLSNLAQLCMLSGRVDDAVRWGEQALAAARDSNDVETEIHALNNIGAALMGAGREGGEPLLERSLALALEHDAEEHAARAYCNLAWAACVHRVAELAERWTGEGVAYTAARDLDAWRLYLMGWRAFHELAVGRFDEAIASAHEVLRSPEASLISRVMPLVVMGLVRARRGDPEAGTALAEALELAERTGEAQRIGPARIARAEAAWLAGDDDRARAELDAGLAHEELAGDTWQRAEFAVWRARLGGIADAVTGAAGPWALELAGDPAAAAEDWAARGMPYDQSLAEARTGVESRRVAALERLLALGARAAHARVARDLRAQGVRSMPRGPRATTRGNPHGLTDRELDVLGELAKGRRNAEIAQALFVSPKTVDHHVSAILAKLEVRSRAEAVARAAAVLSAAGRAGSGPPIK